MTEALMPMQPKIPRPRRVRKRRLPMSAEARMGVISSVNVDAARIRAMIARADLEYARRLAEAGHPQAVWR